MTEPATKLPEAWPKKLIVLMPTRGTVSTETLLALTNNREHYELQLLTVNRTAVDAARNELASQAIAKFAEAAEAEGDDPFVFWMDSDAYFLPGTLTAMLYDFARNPWIDVLAPLSGPRSENHAAAGHTQEGNLLSFVHPGENCAVGDVLEAVFVSTHFFAHRLSLLRRLGAHPFGSPEDLDWTDDGYFSQNVRKSGGRLAISTGVPVFHIEESSGAAFLPYCAAARIEGNAVVSFEGYVPAPKQQRNYGERLDRVFALHREQLKGVERTTE